MQFYPFDSANPNHIYAITSIWNAACGTDLAITPRFVEFNTRHTTGAVQAGRLAIQDERPVGFVLASALPNDPQTSSPDVGWVDAMAVSPNFQRRGIGSALLAWAEEWLRGQACTKSRLGGSLRPFVAGYPVELANDSFFRKRGYHERSNGGETWDVARDLGYFGRDVACNVSTIQIRPAQAGEEDTLLKFLLREFPNRWRFECQEFLRQGGRISDYMLLQTEHGIDGFARLTFEDSERPIERFYMHRLPRPWGQLGPIGVSADVRGKGYGRMLLDAALCYLRDSGVRGCVIDWTGLVDFYGRFGFKPYRRYELLTH